LIDLWILRDRALHKHQRNFDGLHGFERERGCGRAGGDRGQEERPAREKTTKFWQAADNI
jgi:hypothetical protein